MCIICLFAAVVAIDFVIKSFKIVSNRRRRHVASETGFKQDLLNPDSDSLIKCTFH